MFCVGSPKSPDGNLSFIEIESRLREKIRVNAAELRQVRSQLALVSTTTSLWFCVPSPNSNQLSPSRFIELFKGQFTHWLLCEAVVISKKHLRRRSLSQFAEGGKLSIYYVPCVRSLSVYCWHIIIWLPTEGLTKKCRKTCGTLTLTNSSQRCCHFFQLCFFCSFWEIILIYHFITFK